MAQINFRIDDETKRRAERFFEGAGLTMSGAITLFLKQTLIRNALPFAVTGEETDRERIERALTDYDNGKKNYHYHELIDVDEDTLPSCVAEPQTEKYETKPRRSRRAKALA